MSDNIFIFVSAFLIFLINELLVRRKLLINYTGEPHQKFASSANVPLSGGLFLLCFFIYIFYQNNFILNIFIIIFFLLGFFSDLKILKSANQRFFLQVILLLFFLLFSNLTLSNTGINLLDLALENEVFNYLFVLFCILIIINGTNFFDGLNTLVIGYYLIITFLIFHLDLNESINISDNAIVKIIYFLFIIYLFNFFNKFFLGDSGAYILGFIYSFLLISIYVANTKLSSFFIINLLWYPAFENLFSIIRKLLIRKSPLKPDKNHLHQLIFFYFKKKNNTKSYLLNTFAAQAINIYNVLFLIIAAQNIFSNQYQIIILAINLLLYIFLYFRLFIFKFKGHVVQW